MCIVILGLPHYIIHMMMKQGTSMIFVLFRNKRVIGVASTHEQASELMSEYQLAEGYKKGVSFRVATVAEYEFIHNL